MQLRSLIKIRVMVAKRAIFRRMMSLGQSVPWQAALESLAGDRAISSAAILEYYRPLHDWLQAEVDALNINVGW